MALSQKHRLKGKYFFNRVKRLGRNFSSPHFFINIAPAKAPDELKFGFIVSTKIDKRATVRNSVRRQLAQVVYNNINSFPLGHHFVIVARPAASRSTYKELNFSMQQTLSKFKLR